MSFDSQFYVKMFTNMMSEGFIVIDKEGTIQVYNDKAKEIFGIRHDHQISHGKGKINSGDIVIIADNSLGQDDGKMNLDSLKVLNIKDNNIENGDSLIAVGMFNQNIGIDPILKVLKKEEKEDFLIPSV